MQRLYTFCIRFMQSMAFILFGILAVSAFFLTAYVENAYEIVIQLKWDNPLLNLLFLCCFLGLLWGAGQLFSSGKRGPLILLILACLWVFAASLLWSYFSKSGPASDCGSVYYAAKRFAVNDFSAVSYRDSYFSVYPFQLGLAFFYELIFRFAHNDNFHIIQGVNALCLVLCTVSQYHLCGRLFKEKKAQIYTLLLTASCLPFIMYGSFIYGEIPSFAFLLFGTWMLLLFLDGHAPAASGVLALFSLACCVLVRKNSLVFIIALGIILFLWLIQNHATFSRKKIACYLAYFVLLFALSIGVIPMVQALYEKRSGEEINPGIPSSTYLAMGLMEAKAGPGHYSGYNFDTFTIDADYDADIASEIGWNDYRERLSYFASHPGYALRFFGRKFCMEWLNTGWSIFDSTYVSFGERLPVAESCFSGPLYDILKAYMTNYQMVLYLLAAICTFLLFRAGRDENVFLYLFPLTAFGGAILFLAWEASGRYILPYAIFMLPYAGYGMHLLTRRLKTPAVFRQKPSGRHMLGILSAIVVFLLFCYFRRLSPFIYQTNDDLFLKMIVSGEMAGTPEPRMYYISYPAGLLLSGLYKLFPQLPWYGLFFCFTIGLTMGIVLYSLLKREKSLPVRLLTVLLFCLFSYGFLFLHIAELQFTTVTAMAGCGALFLFMLSSPADSLRETLKDNCGFLLLSAYSFCIRGQAFLMFLPVIGMIGLGKYLDAGTSPAVSLFRFNRKRKNLFALAGIFIALIGSLFLVEKLAYLQDDWKTFSAYTEASETVYDYEGYPDYDAYRETYQELGISRSSYEAAAHHYCIALEPGINQKTMETLADIIKQERRLSLSELPGKFREMASFFLDRHLSYTDRPLNLLVYCCYILFFFCGILSGKKKALRDILFLGVARMVIWAYLIFYGRLPSRVSQSAYMAELAVLLAIAFGNQLWAPHKSTDASMDASVKNTPENSGVPRRRLCSACWIFSIVFLTFVCLRFGFPKAKAAAWEASSRLQFSQSFVDMKHYFRAHPDNFYYLDMDSFGSFTEDGLESTGNEYDNFLYMGSWIPHSPWYGAKFEREGISDPAAALYEDPNVFIVFMNTEGISYDYLTDFYAENYPGVSFVIADTVDVSNELQFLVLKGTLSQEQPD